jgi:hypothetical protein
MGGVGKKKKNNLDMRNIFAYFHFGAPLEILSMQLINSWVETWISTINNTIACTLYLG